VALGIKSRVIVPSPKIGGDLASAYPLGDAPDPDPEELAWSGVVGGLTNAGILALETGTAFSHDVRQYLTGDEAATATITIVAVSGDDPTTEGWSITGGNNLAHTGATTGSGVFKLRATGVGSTDDSANISWSCTNDGSQPNTGYDWPAGDEPTNSLATLTAVPTFHNISLYWPEQSGKQPTDVENNPEEFAALVRYRVFGTSEWKQAHYMWWDNREQGSGALKVPFNAKEYRSSIVEVASNTKYEVQVLTPHTRKIASTIVTTWNENVPDGTITVLPTSSTAQLTIGPGDSGTASGYHVYEVNPAGSVIDRNHAGNYCIRIETGAHHIKIRGLPGNYLILRESDEACIGIEPGVSDIWIEYVDASEMGHADTVNPNPDGGFFACNSGGLIDMTTLSETANKGIVRLIIQDNKIHDPAHDSNSWGQDARLASDCGPDEKHPAGVTPIFLSNPGGQIVIRRNEVYSNFGKMFDDGIGGARNFSFNGNLGRDSDVYENIVSYCWDNSIECEGANMNVRIYRNYTEYGLAMMSQGCVSMGPCYVFRNVTTRGIHSPTSTSAEGQWYKSYGKTTLGSNGDPTLMTYGGGRFYLYHNTVYKSATAEIGNGSVRAPFNGDQLGLTSGISRNNIIHSNAAIGSFYIDVINGEYVRQRDATDGVTTPGCSYRYDLVGAGKSAWTQVEGSTCIIADPVYVTSPTDKATLGTYALQIGSPGLDAGVVIPGFNNGGTLAPSYNGTAPDMGAQERGHTPLRFGPL
jgi:hypothetical protein